MTDAEESSSPNGTPPSALDTLNAALDFIGERFQAPRLTVGAHEDDLAAVALALIRVMIVQGEAIAALAATPFAEAAHVNLRALFEAWLDISYLLAPEDRAEQVKRARKALAHGYDSAIKFANEQIPGDTDIESLVRERKRVIDADPAAYKELQQVGDKRFWSGTSRKRLAGIIESLPAMKGMGLASFYTLLSFDSHNLIAHIRDVVREEGDGEVILHHRHFLTATEAGEFYSTVCAKLIASAWEAFARTFGLTDAGTRKRGRG